MFRDKLKLKRKEKNLTQADMANLFSISQTAYSKWERGVFEPDFKTLKKIANYFDVSVDYLLDNEKSTPLCDEVLEINKAMEKVNQEDRQRMVETLKAAFPYAFDDYLWAMNVLQQNDYVMYNSIKAGNSELSKQDIIRIANELKRRCV